MKISDKEYEMLKTEINYWSNEENKYWIFAHTSVGAIIALSLQQNNPIILMGVYFVVLPAIAQLIHVKTNYIFLGTYLSVNYSDSYKWEEMSNNFKINTAKSKLVNSLIIKLRNMSFVFISFFTMLLYIYQVTLDGLWKKSDFLVVSVAGVISIFIFFLCYKYNKDEEVRKKLTAEWSDIIKNKINH